MIVLALVAACAESHPARGYHCTGDPCDDGDACNGLEVCDAERGCLAGIPMACRDDDPCTVDECAAGVCAHSPRDLDGDGHPDPCAGGDDCAPLDPAVRPGAAERCNHRDDDCDLEVDEGLGFGLASETTLPEGIWDPVFLDDGSLVGVRPPPGQAGPWETEAFVFDGVETQTQRLLGSAWSGWLGRFSENLYAGDHAIATLLSGPDVDDVLGNTWHSQQSLQVFDIRPGRSPIAVEIVTIAPPSGEIANPRSVAVARIGVVPIVSWMEDWKGFTRVLVAAVDGGGEPRLVAEGLDVSAKGLSADPSGATIFWSQNGELHASRTDPRGVPVATAALGVSSIVDVGACAVPSGTAFVVANGGLGRPASIELHVLGRDLESTADPLELPELESQRPVSRVSLACMGPDILVLNSVSNAMDDMGERWRLRRVTADRRVDFEELLVGGAHFAAASRPVLVVHRDRVSVARELGCTP